MADGGCEASRFQTEGGLHVGEQHGHRRGALSPIQICLQED